MQIAHDTPLILLYESFYKQKFCIIDGKKLILRGRNFFLSFPQRKCIVLNALFVTKRGCNRVHSLSQKPAYYAKQLSPFQAHS